MPRATGIDLGTPNRSCRALALPNPGRPEGLQLRGRKAIDWLDASRRPTMRKADKHQLIQAAMKRYEDAQARYDELMAVAHTKTPGVDATAEPDDPALRAQRSEAEAARDAALRDVKKLIEELDP